MGKSLDRRRRKRSRVHNPEIIVVSSDESSGDENDNDTDTDIDDNGTNGVQVGEKRPPPLSTLSALRISCSHAATASKHWRPTKDVFVDISAPLALQLRSGLDPVRAAPLLQTVRADIAAIFCWDLIGATRSTGAGGPARVASARCVRGPLPACGKFACKDIM